VLGGLISPTMAGFSYFSMIARIGLETNLLARLSWGIILSIFLVLC